MSSAVVTMDVDTSAQADTVNLGHPKSDLYCFLCSNGGDLICCEKCSRAICLGSCLEPPPNSRYSDGDVVFMCPACHQQEDRVARRTSPYFGFYIFPYKGCDMRSMIMQTLPRVYTSPAKILGSAQFVPRSKFLGEGVAILNFRLNSLDVDTADLGEILGPYAAAFFGGDYRPLLTLEHIKFDQDTDKSTRKHRSTMKMVAKKLKATRSELKKILILVTTHAQFETGNLATSSDHYVDIHNWVDQVVTKEIMDIISHETVDAHWFFFCCGALVKAPSSFERLKVFANEWRPTNLFAFDATFFHPVFASTFILDFFQHVIIEGRPFKDVVGLLFSSSTLSRHTGIVRFWTWGADVRHCTFRWSHCRIQPWGKAVPYQCPTCYCIQAWDQKGNGPSSELRGPVTMSCTYEGEDGRCTKRLFFEQTHQYKALKSPEGIWVAFGIDKSDSL